MTTISPDWLRAPATRRVMAALAEARPLFVGGCVRDALIGRGTADIDIAVTSAPQRTLALAEAAGLGAHPTGVDHGVVTLVADGRAFEVATLRRDVATDGRRAVVAFTEDVAEDAARRDFTINALYADIEGGVIDPLGEGLGDLSARRLRFIGSPEARLREDYLRILRFFRFHAQFGIDAFDPDGLSACRALADGLSRISKERIGAELLKLFAAPDPGPALAAMGPALEFAAPGASADGLAPLIAAERLLELAGDPLRRLAALGLSPKSAEAALRLSKTDRARLEAIEAARAARVPPAAAAYRWGASAAEDAAAFALACGAAAPPAGWRSDVARGAAARPPVEAKDLLARGARSGPALGDALRRIETRWIELDLRASRDELLGWWGDAGAEAEPSE